MGYVAAGEGPVASKPRDQCGPSSADEGHHAEGPSSHQLERGIGNEEKPGIQDDDCDSAECGHGE